ncbi:D-glycero-alpha-D-manno-heptose-1,7-bisphosphate 7-phosphatase [Streptomyces afghaniensis]|uniref:D-glycero-alpha-D-manno-heptose-1,7-bisphosphate 7-phosphatase n=1 Tax=Streptomyces TaxID=1883 RepID=UPI00055EF4D7|nr:MULTISPECIES: HAD-IIIA family hydrolase [Streptomyces]UOB12701.1 HAD family hydrolase [Streptomyces sp. HP-A2021]
MSGRPAVFLDRDGTVTEPRHYPSRPDDLVLEAGVGPSLRRLQQQGAALVVVTNQSGVARGLFTEAQLLLMHERLRDLLADHGVTLDGIYFCPHHRDGRVEALAISCRCRKPEPGLLLRAAVDLGIHLQRSWMVGDFLSDVGAGHRAGCRTALVGPLGAQDVPPSGPAPDLRTVSTAEALQRISDHFDEEPS